VGGNAVLALRAAAGTTSGEPRFKRSFELGGFPEGAMLDVIGTNPGLLRGYPDGAFRGRSFVCGNAELRLPLAHPQRGWRLLPLFVRHLHGSVFVDAGDAASGHLRADRLKAGVGAAVGTDAVVFHVLPLTASVAVAQGLSHGGDTRVYFRTGVAF
jgi:hypothetical protein